MIDDRAVHARGNLLPFALFVFGVYNGSRGNALAE